MKLRFDYNNMMDSAIGSHGIKASAIDKAQKAHAAAFADVIETAARVGRSGRKVRFSARRR